PRPPEGGSPRNALNIDQPSISLRWASEPSATSALARVRTASAPECRLENDRWPSRPTRPSGLEPFRRDPKGFGPTRDSSCERHATGRLAERAPIPRARLFEATQNVAAPTTGGHGRCPAYTPPHVRR